MGSNLTGSLFFGTCTLCDQKDPGNEARWHYGYVGSVLGDQISQDLDKWFSTIASCTM